MKQPVEPRWEEHLKAVARTFPYPPTPDLAGAVQQRLAHRGALPRGFRLLRPTLAFLLALIMLLAGLWVVPSVRAALLEWLQIGAVRIWLVEPTPNPTSAPQPIPTPLVSLFDLAGATTLTEAQQQAGFPLRLPTYPADLGAPDHVFVQQTNGWFVVLLWMEPTDRQQVRLVLYEVGPGVGLEKGMPTVLRETLVKGQPAIWIEGTHYLKQVNGDWGMVRFIDQEVLVWREAVDGQEITYRLETALPEAQAIAIAESLR